MKCDRCNSPEELKWAENWKSGDRPINTETNLTHQCNIVNLTRPKESGWFCMCQTKLIDCGCENCHYIGIPLYCPRCDIHPGGLRYEE